MRLMPFMLLNLAVIAVSALAAPRALAAGEQVAVYMYSEYIDPEIPKAFEKLTGIKVRIDVYEAQEEMLAKLRVGGNDQYDVIVASDVVIPSMIALGLIQPLDQAKIANRGNVGEHFRNPDFDPGNKYSWPYQWGTIGLMYRKDKVPAGELSWALLFDDAKQSGPFVLMDEQRSMLGIAHKYLGHSTNSVQPDELKAAGEALLKAKRSAKCLGFDGGVAGKNKVAAGEAVAAVVYNGDAVKAMDDNDKVAFAIPKEGALIAVDVMVVSAKAPNLAAAHRFIDYILDAKVGAQLSNFNRYATPNAAALPMINAKDRENPAVYPSEAIMKTLEYLRDLGKDSRLYDEVWTAVKAR